jgi:hypothetical protein
MFPVSTDGATSLRVRLVLAFLLVAMLGIPGVPSFAETPETPAGETQSKETAPPKPAAAATERERRPQPLDEVSTIFEQKGVLTPKGSVTFEPSVQFTHLSTNRVALLGYTIVPSITIGLITIQDVDDDALVAAMAFRYGITNRLELEFKVPYVYRSNSAASNPLNAGTVNTSLFNANGYGFGDVETTLRYQINQPVGPGGIYIGSMRFKFRNGEDPFQVPYNPVAEGVAGAGLPTELPVGSGFYALQPAITLIYPSDPAVLFGTLNYQWNIQRNVSGVGEVDPADALGINFGMGIGLNENLSFSLGYEHTILGKSTLDGERLGNSKTTQVGTLILGTSFRISNRTNANLSLGIGATDTSPDMQLTVKVPMNFF